MSLLKSIKLGIAQKLRDAGYRRRFFRNLTQDEIAQQIRALRKKRGLRQKDLADLTKTTQSAISRLEQAEYSKWSFSTLTGIADALDARIRVIFEPAEMVIAHYERLEAGDSRSAASDVLEAAIAEANTAARQHGRQRITSFEETQDVMAQGQRQTRRVEQSEIRQDNQPAQWSRGKDALGV